MNFAWTLFWLLLLPYRTGAFFFLHPALPKNSVGQIEQTKHFPVSNFDAVSKLSFSYLVGNEHSMSKIVLK